GAVAGEVVRGERAGVLRGVHLEEIPQRLNAGGDRLVPVAGRLGEDEKPPAGRAPALPRRRGVAARRERHRTGGAAEQRAALHGRLATSCLPAGTRPSPRSSSRTNASSAAMPAASWSGLRGGLASTSQV